MDDMASVVRGIELGAEDYLAKPIDPVLLHARLRSSLERKRLRDQEHLYLQGLQRELEIGRQIQGEFLPTTLPRLPGWDLAAHFQAARDVAGDFYDVFSLADKGQLVFLLGDVSDKGVGAALYMTLFRTLLRTMASLDQFVAPLRCPDDPDVAWGEGTDPLEHAVSLTNKYVASLHGQSSMFATLFFGLLDPTSGRLRYINAGHEPPLLFDAQGVKQELVPTGPLIGLLPYADFAWAETHLEPGDGLLVYTDGVTEAPDGNRVLFGQERLLELLAPPPSTARGLLDHVVTSVQQYAGPLCQADDITMLAVRRETT
jgi:serine phosphatase RsbU (regulator of sigma subunit)